MHEQALPSSERRASSRELLRRIGLSEDAPSDLFDKDVLDAPLFDDGQEGGSTYFHEPLDIVLGVIWDGGEGRGEFVKCTRDGADGLFQPTMVIGPAGPRRRSNAGAAARTDTAAAAAAR